MTLYLIRHGQDQDNAKGVVNGHHDDNLTNLGKIQASVTGQKLIGKNIQAIYSSPLKRCLETAKIIGQELKINHIEVKNELIDRDFGKLTGLSLSYISEHKAELVDGSGIEPVQSVYQRVGKVLMEIKLQYPEGNIVIVTHGDPSQMLRAVFLKISIDEGFKLPYLMNGELVKLQRDD